MKTLTLRLSVLSHYPNHRIYSQSYVYKVFERIVEAHCSSKHDFPFSSLTALSTCEVPDQRHDYLLAFPTPDPTSIRRTRPAPPLLRDTTLSPVGGYYAVRPPQRKYLAAESGRKISGLKGRQGNVLRGKQRWVERRQKYGYVLLQWIRQIRGEIW